VGLKAKSFLISLSIVAKKSDQGGIESAYCEYVRTYTIDGKVIAEFRNFDSAAMHSEILSLTV